MSPTQRDPKANYEIRVQGRLDRGWEGWFDGLATIVSPTSDLGPTTTLVLPSVDQAALRGVLGKLWDLNLTLISVQRVEADERKSETDE